ncbi:MAG: SDR family oxidoreductase [Candidatus Kapabacteria bacterium]|nr:SDR family oxidoreductase [Candidatus Kapabacteria bacterium]
MNNILVTGSAKRIGASIARHFASKGWNVALHYFSSKNDAERLVKELQQYGTKVEVFLANFLHQSEIENLIHSVKQSFGSIDVLVSTVGVFPERSTLQTITDKRFEETFKLNVFSQFDLISAYTSIEQSGRIITFGSIGAKKILKNRLDYSVSKNAVIRLTEAAAKEIAPNFQCNCLCPGAIVLEDENEESIAQMGSLDSIPMKRYGNINDIIEAVEFFATCTPFITGQTLCIDGGQSL